MNKDYDWEERQERVNFLIEAFSKRKDSAKFNVCGTQLTGTEIVEHLKNGTDIGREFVAVAGMVLGIKFNRTSEDPNDY